MKKALLIAVMLGTAFVSRAALLDDFEGYSLGNASNASPPWVTSEASFYADIELVGGSQTLTMFGDADWRDISRTVGGTFAGVMTNEFDVYISDEENVDHAFGLSDLAAPSWYDQFGPIVRITTDFSNANEQVSLDVYDGGYQDDQMALDLFQWYTIKLIADTGTQTYDVYVDDTLIYGSAAFRKSITEVKSWGTMVGQNPPTGALAIDNLTYTGFGAPFSFGDTMPADGATGVTNLPTLEATITLGTDSSLDMAMYLDGEEVTTLSSSAATSTVSYAVTSPFDALTVHTAMVVVAGTPSGAEQTNTWTFTTAPPAGTYVPADYTLYDDFEGYLDGADRFTNGVTTAGKWLYIDGSTIATEGSDTGLADIENDGENTYARFGWGYEAGSRGFVSDVSGYRRRPIRILFLPHENAGCHPRLFGRSFGPAHFHNDQLGLGSV